MRWMRGGLGATWAYVLLTLLTVLGAQGNPPGKVPLLYSSDLFHPPSDPDDHYDLATLCALAEIDVRGMLFDLRSDRPEAKAGLAAIRQMNRITGRNLHAVLGLRERLTSPTDQGFDQPAPFQAGVELLLTELRRSPTKVTVFLVGGCRDVAAAYNREPGLVREKLQALYINAGNGPGGPQWETNVWIDPHAYQRLLTAELPLYWCPCWGVEPRRPSPDDVRDQRACNTLFMANQATVLSRCCPAVRNFFTYCLTRATADPLAFLGSPPQPPPPGLRPMWSTAPMLHAAGRHVYRCGDADFAALTPEEARRRGLAGAEVELYRFDPVRVAVEWPSAERPFPKVAGQKAPAQFALRTTPVTQANVRMFLYVHPQYGEILTCCLKNLLGELGR